MSNDGAALVTGAGGAIARALLAHLHEHTNLRLFALSRRPPPDDLPSSVHWLTQDYSDASLAAVRESIEACGVSLSFLCITNGVLHEGDLQPERSLRALQGEHMRRVFEINALLPMRILAAMTPLLRQATAPKIVALSARVGSIGDNGLGGWYSYRGSKAALNMMLKSAAIEFRRLNRRTKLVAFHPGTTDSDLSKPFQARVPADKLFTPDFVAERLWRVVSELEPDGELAYVDWAGESIPW